MQKTHQVIITSKSGRFSAVFESLDEIHSFIADACQTARLSEQKTYITSLSMSEACSNIIQHAYSGSSNGWIDCTWIVRPESLEITLYDQGKPFNMEATPLPDLEGNIDQRRQGGLGIYLIRKSMDEVRYYSLSIEQAESIGKAPGNYLVMSILREQ